MSRVRYLSAADHCWLLPMHLRFDSKDVQLCREINVVTEVSGLFLLLGYFEVSLGDHGNVGMYVDFFFFLLLFSRSMLLSHLAMLRLLFLECLLMSRIINYEVNYP